MNWLLTRQTPRRSKKLRREPLLRLKHFKRKREKPVLRFPRLLRLYPSALPDLAVLLALFVQFLVIWAPKVDTPTIHPEFPICVFDAASEVTGPISVTSGSKPWLFRTMRIWTGCWRTKLKLCSREIMRELYFLARYYPSFKLCSRHHP